MESRGHPAVQRRSLYAATPAANYHLRLLTHFPLAQLTHKSGLLRQNQFLFLVLLLILRKATPELPELWPLLTHQGQSPTLPQSHSRSQIKAYPQSYSKLDFTIFYLQNVLRICLLKHTLEQTSRKVSQPSFIQSSLIPLEYGFSQSLHFIPSGPPAPIPPLPPCLRCTTRS